MSGRWPKEKEDELRALSAAGASREKMVENLGYSKSAVSKKLMRLGLREGKENYAPKVTHQGVRLRAITTQGQSWDQKVSLPYALWKEWNKKRRNEDGKEA